MTRTALVLATALALGAVAAPAAAADGPELVANPRHALVENLAPGQVRTLLSTIENVSKVDAAMAITAVSESATATQLDPVQLTIDVCTAPWLGDPAGLLSCNEQELRIVAGWQVQGTVSVDSTLRIDAGERVYLRTQVSLSGDEVPSGIQGRSGSIAFAVSASEAPPLHVAVQQPVAAMPVTGMSVIGAVMVAGAFLALGIGLTLAARTRRQTRLEARS